MLQRTAIGALFAIVASSIAFAGTKNMLDVNGQIVATTDSDNIKSGFGGTIRYSLAPFEKVPWLAFEVRGSALEQDVESRTFPDFPGGMVKSETLMAGIQLRYTQEPDVMGYLELAGGKTFASYRMSDSIVSFLAQNNTTEDTHIKSADAFYAGLGAYKFLSDHFGIHFSFGYFYSELPILVGEQNHNMGPEFAQIEHAHLRISGPMLSLGVAMRF